MPGGIRVYSDGAESMGGYAPRAQLPALPEATAPQASWFDDWQSAPPILQSPPFADPALPDASLPSLPEPPMAHEGMLSDRSPSAVLQAIRAQGPDAPGYPSPPMERAVGANQQAPNVRVRYGSTPGTSAKITRETVKDAKPAKAASSKAAQALTFAQALGFDVADTDPALVQAAFAKATRGMKVAQLLSPKNLEKTKALFQKYLAPEAPKPPASGTAKPPINPS